MEWKSDRTTSATQPVRRVHPRFREACTDVMKQVFTQATICFWFVEGTQFTLLTQLSFAWRTCPRQIRKLIKALKINIAQPRAFPMEPERAPITTYALTTIPRKSPPTIAVFFHTRHTIPRSIWVFPMQFYFIISQT